MTLIDLFLTFHSVVKNMLIMMRYLYFLEKLAKLIIINCGSCGLCELILEGYVYMYTIREKLY